MTQNRHIVITSKYIIPVPYMLLSLYDAVVLWHSVEMNAIEGQECVCEKLMYLVISGLLATCPPHPSLKGCICSSLFHKNLLTNFVYYRLVTRDLQCGSMHRFQLLMYGCFYLQCFFFFLFNSLKSLNTCYPCPLYNDTNAFWGSPHAFLFQVITSGVGEYICTFLISCCTVRKLKCEG